MTATPKSKESQLVEYIPAEEYQEIEHEAETEELVVTDWNTTMEALSTPTTRLRVPRSQNVNRQQVISAFTNAFELIGGVPRLALWAHDNPSQFYKLYSRLLPSQASQALGETNEIIIRHVLPRGPLDE